MCLMYVHAGLLRHMREQHTCTASLAAAFQGLPRAVLLLAWGLPACGAWLLTVHAPVPQDAGKHEPLFSGAGAGAGSTSGRQQQAGVPGVPPGGWPLGCVGCCQQLLSAEQRCCVTTHTNLLKHAPPTLLPCSPPYSDPALSDTATFILP